MIAAIALDLGSTSVKAGLLQADGELIGIVAMPAPVITVDGEYRESDALAYAHTAEQVLEKCLSQTSPLPPLGLCCQRSSFLIWEKASGRPVTPLISWQDMRGSQSCEALRDKGLQISDLSGLRLTPYYFAPKLRVLLQEHPQWRARLESGEYLAGTLDTFLVWRWTGGVHHVTDASMAARTLLMDVRRMQWSPALCDIFDIPLAALAQIVPSIACAIPLDNGLTLQACVGDQSAAYFASIGADSKAALVNLGTGGFVMRGMEQEKFELMGYLRTLLYRDRASSSHVAVEGTLNSIAAALAGYPVSECRAEELATSDIFCLAEPGGLGAPYFRSDFGIRFSHPVAHLSPREIAALLIEGIVFRVARILEDLHRASPVERVYLSGGLSELPCVQQGLAQCVTIPVYKLLQRESSLLGAALMAAGMSNAGGVPHTVIVADEGARMREKYTRWKGWLDALLMQNHCRSGFSPT